MVSKDKKNFETRGDKIAFFEQLSERKKYFLKNSLNKLRLSEQTSEGKNFFYKNHFRNYYQSEQTYEGR